MYFLARRKVFSNVMSILKASREEMFRFLIGGILILGSFQLKAENCSDCPKGAADFQHCFGLKINEWGAFHCDQIRQLREQVGELEKIVQKQSKLIQSQQEKIEEIEWRL